MLTFEELKEKYPKLVNDLKKKYERDRIISSAFLIAVSVLFLILMIVSFNTLIWLSLIYGLLGSVFMGFAGLRRLESICLMCTTRFSYNKDLAEDMVKSTYLIEMGIYLVVFSVLGQAVTNFQINQLLGV